MTTSFPVLVLYFSLYSVLGWACESLWCSAGQRKWVNRGFLTGPYCPIYGFGALIILLCCVPLKAYPVLVFLVAMVAASALEYFTGWLLETLFHTRWWDYLHRRFQIKGRVCLRNALLFGLMGLAATYVLDPPVERLIGLLSPAGQWALATGLLLVLAVDLAHALFTLLKLQEKLRHLRDAVAALEASNTQFDWYDPQDLQGSTARLRAINRADGGNEAADALLERLDVLVGKQRRGLRLLRAFPRMTHRELNEELKLLRQSLREDLQARRKARKP